MRYEMIGEEACFGLAKRRILFSQKTQKYNLIFLAVWVFYVNKSGVRQSKYASAPLSLILSNYTFRERLYCFP